MKRLALFAVLVPAPAFAHDAFGDLGPFYASLLHPLADPMQAALLLGTAAFLAGRPLETVRLALPLFIGAAALAYILLGWLGGLLLPPLPAAAAAVAAGLAATLPASAARTAPSLALVAATGGLAGLAPGAPSGDAFQPLLGTMLGIAAIAILFWAALDTLARRVSRLAPAVAGSWVAAVGLLAGAFTLAPPAPPDATVQPIAATSGTLAQGSQP